MADEKIALITKGLSEIMGSNDTLRKIVTDSTLRVYWGTAPTGRIHIGYLIPMMKIADLLNAGCEVTILIADLHAMLDKLKSTEKQLTDRTKYYELTIRGLLTCLGVSDHKNLRFTTGSQYQMTPEYFYDLLTCGSYVTQAAALHAGAEVVKQTNTAYLNDLLYPVMQVLDEKYLGVHAELGGVDQRKIFALSHDMKQLKKKAPLHLMHALIPALSTTEPSGETVKMSSSDNKSVKIDILDGKKAMSKKINSVYCLEKDTKKNPILDLCKTLIYPLLDYTKVPFVIKRKEEYGGDVTYSSYDELSLAFETDLHPQDLKNAVTTFMLTFLEPVRIIFDEKENNKLLASYN